MISCPISMFSGLNGSKVTSLNDANARRPDSPLDGLGALLLGGPRAEIGEPDDHGQQDRGESCQQGATDDLPPGELGLVDDLVQLGQHVVLVVIAGCCAVPVIDHLLVVHQLAGPLHSAHAEEKQRKAEGQAEEEVSAVGSQRTEVDP